MYWSMNVLVVHVVRYFLETRVSEFGDCTDLHLITEQALPLVN
jgi:hypothetical protein